MSNVTYKKSRKQCKIYKAEQKGHGDVDEHLEAKPHIKESALRLKRKTVRKKKQN